MSNEVFKTKGKVTDSYVVKKNESDLFLRNGNFRLYIPHTARGPV